MEFESIEEKIKYLENLVEEKKIQLAKERKESNLILPNLRHSVNSDNDQSEEEVSSNSENL